MSQSINQSTIKTLIFLILKNIKYIKLVLLIYILKKTFTNVKYIYRIKIDLYTSYRVDNSFEKAFLVLQNIH